MGTPSSSKGLLRQQRTQTTGVFSSNLYQFPAHRGLIQSPLTSTARCAQVWNGFCWMSAGKTFLPLVSLVSCKRPGQKDANERIIQVSMLVWNRLQAKLLFARCWRGRWWEGQRWREYFRLPNGKGSSEASELFRAAGGGACTTLKMTACLNATTLPAGPCSGALWLEREPLPSGDAQQMSSFNEISHSVEGLLWSMCHSQQVTSWRLHRPATLGKVRWNCDEADKP